MKIVLDTNVLIAALITRGVCSDLLEHCIQHHEIIAAEFILNELHRNLSKKFNYDEADIEEVINLLQPKIQIVAIVEMEAAVCRDPDDDKILGTALSARAACIVTGDKDLLEIKNFHAIDIIRPSEFSEYEAKNG